MLSARPALRFAARRAPAGAEIVAVNPARRYQRFLGVGAALTDASAWLIWNELPPPRRTAMMTALFAPPPAGIHLSFLRIPIGASDFTVGGVPYSYDDQPPGESDPSLAEFSIAHDEPYILPALRAARALNPQLYTEALPWSPPAWMKSNDSLANRGDGGRLTIASYAPLAAYVVRFLEAYAALGVPIQAIAPQNEPGVGTSYPGMQLTPDQEALFIQRFLDPALAAAGLRPAVFGWDLSWQPLRDDNPLIAAPRNALRGLAWHCYFGDPSEMTLARAENPALLQIVDECSTGRKQRLPTAEMLIASLRNWASAVAAWNLALDPRGGPVQRPNRGCAGCTGIITVDERHGTATPTVDFGELGQLSRFVSPGAVRVASPQFVRYGVSPDGHPVVSRGLDDVAFENRDGSLVLVTYNLARRPVRIALEWHHRYAVTSIPSGATTTFRWR